MIDASCGIKAVLPCGSRRIVCADITRDDGRAVVVREDFNERSWSVERLQLTSVDGIELDAAAHPTAVRPIRGAVLLVHGVTVDMDEGGGMFVRLANQLTAVGFDVARFSFRGHGASGGIISTTNQSGKPQEPQLRSERGPLLLPDYGSIRSSESLLQNPERLERVVGINRDRGAVAKGSGHCVIERGVIARLSGNPTGVTVGP